MNGTARGRGIEFGAPVALGARPGSGAATAPWRPAPRTLGRAKAVPAAGIFDPEVKAGSPYGRPATEAYGAHPEWVRILSEEGFVEFRELPESGVRFTVREVARLAHRLASEALDLPGATLHWFASTDDDDRREKRAGVDSFTSWLARAEVRGFVNKSHPREVWVRASASTRDTFETVCHELRHVWQARADPVAYRDPANTAACEEDAANYAAECLAWFDQVTGRAW